MPGAVLGCFRPKLALLVMLLGRSYLIFTAGETEVRKSCGLTSLQSVVGSRFPFCKVF